MALFGRRRRTAIRTASSTRPLPTVGAFRMRSLEKGTADGATALVVANMTMRDFRDHLREKGAKHMSVAPTLAYRRGIRETAQTAVGGMGWREQREIYPQRRKLTRQVFPRESS